MAASRASAMRRISSSEGGVPRVVVIGLASCFGCQLQITNAESCLVDVMGQVDMKYWQLTSSDPMPDDFDIAIIEGAVTTEQARDTVLQARSKARAVITVGACAATAGIPGLAVEGTGQRAVDVYADAVPAACGDMIAPASVPSIIPVDAQVRCCPIDPYDFIDTLQRVLHGSNRSVPTKTLCGDCKENGWGCFYERGKLCLGLVTRAGCGARCPNLGRACNGCAGLSPDANLDSARQACRAYGVDVDRFDAALRLFNNVPASDMPSAPAEGE